MAKLAIDTNVIAVANGGADQASAGCELACIRRLKDITDHHVVLLDRSQLIIAEYRRHASASGQPGFGDAFMKWLWNNRCNPDRCVEIALTPLDHGDFEEFPESLRVAGFDRNDRKFVAVALVGSPDPTVLNAVDSDYVVHLQGLQAEGLHIEFLCPDIVGSLGAA